MTALTTKLSENEKKKDKEKKEKNTAPTKVVVRRLPPAMTEDDFLEQVSPIPDHDYLRFVRADYSLGQDAFCRAYINFLSQEDIFIFQERFDGYVFVDAKGNEYIAVVEFAPYQKTGVQKDGKRKDPKINSIEQDPEYIKFLELIEKGHEGTGNTVESTLEEIEQREREAKAGRGPENQMTPLLTFLKEKKDEKLKKREELKDLRKKKEEERRRAREEERKRRDLKDKEIREKDKKDKDKKTDKTEEDLKTKSHEKKKERDRKDKDNLKDGENLKESEDCQEQDPNKTEKDAEKKESEKKDRKEIERERRLAREEKEKERFRKREEERIKQRERKMLEKKKEKKESEKEDPPHDDKEKNSDDKRSKDKDDKRRNFKDEREDKRKSTKENKKEPVKEESKSSVLEIKEESKTKRYSDRRKEERLKREREKAEKKKKDDGSIVTIIDVDDESSKDDVTECIYSEANDRAELKQDCMQEVVDAPNPEKEKKVKKSYRERREERERRTERKETETDRKKNNFDDSEKEKRDKKFKKPDMQLYRPGMGKFSSKSISKKEDASGKSPKTSPEESRESSPSKKTVKIEKFSRNVSPDDKRTSKQKKKNADDHSNEEDKPHNSREYYNKKKAPSADDYAQEESKGSKTNKIVSSKGYRANREAKADKRKKEDPDGGVSEKDKEYTDIETSVEQENVFNNYEKVVEKADEESMEKLSQACSIETAASHHQENDKTTVQSNLHSISNVENESTTNHGQFPVLSDNDITPLTAAPTVITIDND